MPPELLTVENLSYAPEAKPVLDGVSFQVNQGEFLTILGPNGAGKSTLLKHVVRLLPVRRGRIALHGRPLAEFSHRALARLVAYVPQAKGFVPPYRTREFLLMNRYPHLSPFEKPGARDLAIVDQVLRAVGMTGFGDRFLDTLSGGERQKVYIAAAMVQEAETILLDEPATYLDPHHALEIYRLLQELHQGGKTLLMVTHDVNAALGQSRQVLCLKAGRVLYFGTASGLDPERVLPELYEVPFCRYACVSHPAQPPAFLAGGGGA
jgi:iron complex transport system ATP-binding protein